MVFHPPPKPHPASCVRATIMLATFPPKPVALTSTRPKARGVSLVVRHGNGQYSPAFIISSAAVIANGPLAPKVCPVAHLKEVVRWSADTVA